MVALITEGPELSILAGLIVFPAVAISGLRRFFTSRPAILIDDRGMRSPFFGWDVLWGEVERVALRTRYYGMFAVRTLVVHVRDPGAVGRARVVLGLLDTPRDEILAAVERRVPIER